MPTVTRESDKVDFVELVSREKHNRDVELTDLIEELAERYGHLMRKGDVQKIYELTKPL